MYLLNNRNLTPIGKKTLKEINFNEADFEELLRKNIGILSGNDIEDDEESILIVGQQVRNKDGGRSDLIAIDDEGSIVLIEIKRDKIDSINRREPFEFQAIRYAAGMASIKNIQELVKKSFEQYIKKHSSEFELGTRSASEFAVKTIEDFLDRHNATKFFNLKQRIILIASQIDLQTQSAVAWLNRGGIDIQCFELDVYSIDEQIYVLPKKVLPIPQYEDYFIEIAESNKKEPGISKIARRNLPRIDELIVNKVVKAGDIIVPKDHPGEAILLANGNVDVNGEEMSMQVWLKNIYGWASIQTYVFAVHQEKGKTLSQLRKEYMEKSELPESND
jgi:hypothetical protein